jgi:integrase
MGSPKKDRGRVRSAGGSPMGEIIRRTKDGKFIGYYLRFYERGRRRVLASRQPSYAEARRMLLTIEARIARGALGIPEPKEELTLAELCERFVAEYSRPRIKNLETYRAHTRWILKSILPHLGRLPVSRITRADVARARDALGRSRAAGTVCNTLDRLSAVFAWAVREGLAPLNPCQGVERPRTEPSLDYLGREEVQRLIEAAQAQSAALSGHRLYVGIMLAVHTGLRKGELLGLRWRDLDLDAGRLTVARSYQATPKSGKARHLRLPSELVPILRAWRSVCPGSPFDSVLPVGRTLGDASRNRMLGLPRLMSSIGLRKVLHPWHLLRHTFASHFVMSGGSIPALQAILGHSDLKMTMLYAHLAPDFLGQEMERVSFSRRSR